jgi:hypothetical protein
MHAGRVKLGICPELRQKSSISAEHRLNTIKRRAGENCEFPLKSIAGKRCGNSRCSLFSIFSLIPKLNVAGSIPVSRPKSNGKECAPSALR